MPNHQKTQNSKIPSFKMIPQITTAPKTYPETNKSKTF